MKKIKLLFLGLILGFLTFSCVDEDFDVPPEDSDIADTIETNATIQDIVNLWQEGQFTTIDEDLVFDAIVAADDQSGNYFRRIPIIDETGGILLSINRRELHVDFPVGRKITIKAKDLIISDFNLYPQLGGEIIIDDGEEELGGIEESLIPRFILFHEFDNEVPVRTKTINELGFNDLSTLVKLENVQFADSELGNNYAEEDFSANRTLIECNTGEEIIVRTSSFASFSDEPLPQGSGDIYAIYSVFGDERQLTIRDLNDVNLENERCEGGSTGNCDDISGDLISFEQIRNDFNGSDYQLPNNAIIEGTVISNQANGSISNRNFVVQDNSGYGAVLRLADGANIGLGTKVKVDVSNINVSNFRETMQIGEIPSSGICEDGTGSVDPLVVTIDEIRSNFERYESTLVQIENAQLTSSGSTWSDGVTVDDGTGTLFIFTRNDADYSSESFPTDSVRITGYLNQFDSELQLSIRSPGDVIITGGGGGTGDDEITLPYTQDFNGGIPSGWELVATTGDRLWEGRDFDNVFYANMSAFAGNGNPIVDVVTWMIMDPIDFDLQSNESITLMVADAFENGNPFKIMYSTDYDGLGNPNSANWTEFGSSEIDAVINNSGSFDNIYETVGPLDLSNITGKAYIAFVYDSNGGNISTTIQLSNIAVE